MKFRQVLGRHVRNVREVFAFLDKLFQILLVHNLWASGVDKHSVLWHFTHESIVD